MFFLDNLFLPDQFFGYQESSGYDYLEVNVQPLISRLNGGQTPALVAFSTSHTETVISQAPCPSPLRRLANLFRKSLHSLAFAGIVAYRCCSIHVSTSCVPSARF